MNLKLFVDIYNRKLVKSVTSDFPVSLPTIFREDWIDLEVTLLRTHRHHHQSGECGGCGGALNQGGHW